LQQGSRTPQEAGVPSQIKFQDQTAKIALEQIRWACEAGCPRGVVG